MMQAIVIKSPAYTKYHFGVSGLDATALNKTSLLFHSDTLFSALVNSYSETEVDVDLFVEQFCEVPEVQISSGSFCLERNGKYIFFLNKPHFLNLLIEEEINYKLFKGLQFISKGIWEKGYTSTEIFNPEKCVLLGGKFACTINELRELDIDPRLLQNFIPYHTRITPKVKNHTKSREDNLYFQASVELGNIYELNLNTHYYFLITENRENKIINDEVLQMFCLNGIGGELSVGCGHIESFERVDLEIDLGEKSGDGVNQSLIIPASQVDLDRIRYSQMCVRGGRRLGEGRQWLKEVHVITEGALIAMGDESIGTTVNISPSLTQKYLRYGKGFVLPFHLFWSEKLLKYEQTLQL